MKQRKEKAICKTKMIHVSFDLVDKFKPRVPQQRCPGEDETIPRICAAPNILSALQAIPQAGEVIWTMYRCGLPIIIHAYYFKSEYALYPEQIKDKVGDAEATGEMWLLEGPASVYRVDWEITDFIAPMRTDRNGTKARFVVCVTNERRKYQDNWENFAEYAGLTGLKKNISWNADPKTCHSEHLWQIWMTNGF